MRHSRAIALVVSVLSAPAMGATFTWNQAGGTHDWQNNANWTPSGFPNAAGDQADFTNNITAGQTVRVLNPKVTTGILSLGDSVGTPFGFSIVPQSAVSTTAEQVDMNNNGVAAQINSLTGSNSIYANIVATGTNQDLTVNVASGSTLSIGDAVSANRAPTVGRLIKTGPGTVFMGGSSVASSNQTVRIEGGTIFTVGTNPLENNSVLTLVNNSRLQNGGGRTQHLAEVRGNGGLFDGNSGSLRVGTAAAALNGMAFTSGGRTRPGDITGDGGGAGGLGSGTGEVGRIEVGEPSNPSTNTRFESGHEFYFDITGPDTGGAWTALTSANIDQINVPRAITTVNGGDIYINLTFTPTLNQKFRLFINNSTRGFIDGTPGTPLFDNIYDNDPAPDYHRSFKASLSDFVNEVEGGGWKAITFQYVPEPTGAIAIMLMAGAFGMRRCRCGS